MQCCLHNAVIVALVICAAWYLHTGPENVVGYWATLDGRTFEISKNNSPRSGNLVITGDGARPVEGSINAVRMLQRGGVWGSLTLDDRVIQWNDGRDWYRQGV